MEEKNNAKESVVVRLSKNWALTSSFHGIAHILQAKHIIANMFWFEIRYCIYGTIFGKMIFYTNYSICS